MLFTWPKPFTMIIIYKKRKSNINSLCNQGQWLLLLLIVLQMNLYRKNNNNNKRYPPFVNVSQAISNNAWAWGRESKGAQSIKKSNKPLLFEYVNWYHFKETLYWIFINIQKPESNVGIYIFLISYLFCMAA